MWPASFNPLVYVPTPDFYVPFIPELINNRFVYLYKVGQVSKFELQKHRYEHSDLVKSLNEKGKYFMDEEIGDFDLAPLDKEASIVMESKWDKFTHYPPVDDAMYLMDFMFKANAGIYSKTSPWSLKRVIAEQDRSKSCGYVFRMNNFKTKGDCFDDQKWRSWLKVNRYSRYDFLYEFFKKEELRTLDRVKLKKTRGILNAPVDHIVRYGQYIYPLLYQCLSKPLIGPSTLGVCPFYGGWNTLAKKLKIHLFGFECDISGQDMSNNVIIMTLEHLFTKQFLILTEEQSNDYDWLFLQSVFKKCVMVDGTVVLIPFGRATGEVKTSFGNTNVAILLFYWVFSYLIEKHLGLNRKGIQCLNFFFEHVIHVHNGDDCNFSVSHEVIKWLDVDEFCSVGKTLGFTFEFLIKIPSDPTSLRFLGLDFIWQEGIYLPAADKAKVLACVFRKAKIRERTGSPWIGLSRLSNLRTLLYPHKLEFEKSSLLLKDFIAHWDKIFYGHPDWINAKKSFHSSARLSFIYTGNEDLIILCIL